MRIDLGIMMVLIPSYLKTIGLINPKRGLVQTTLVFMLVCISKLNTKSDLSMKLVDF